MSSLEENRKAAFKPSVDIQSGRRRRQETQHQIRKSKKEENMLKRRMGHTNNASGMTTEKEEGVVVSQKKAPTPDDLPELMKVILAPESTIDQRIEAVRDIRRMLSVERNPPVEEVLRAGALPPLVEFLKHGESGTLFFDSAGTLVFEAAWALTNIASTHRTRDVVEGGAIAPLIALMRHRIPDVREQAVWCLGNIAGDCSEFRDEVLRHGIAEPILLNLQSPDNMSLLNNMVWVISNLCRGKPSADLEIVGAFIPPLAQIINNNAVTEDVKVDAVWALAYMSDGCNDRIQKVMESNVTPKLIEFSKNLTSQLLTPTVRCLGNFISGDNKQTQAVLDAGILKNIVPLLECNRATIRKETCWLLSNVAAGTYQQIESLFTYTGIIERIVQLSMNSAWNIKKEALWTLANICTTGSEAQVQRIVSHRGLEALSDAVTSAQSDPKILVVVLEAIARILQVGKTIGAGYEFLLDEYEGIEKIENLQEHPNDDVYKEAVSIIEKFFSEDEAVDENIAPELNSDGTFAFGMTSKQLFPGSPEFNFGGPEQQNAPMSPAHPIMFGSPSNSFVSRP